MALYKFSEAEASALLDMSVAACVDAALDLKDSRDDVRYFKDLAGGFRLWCRIVAELHQPAAAVAAPLHIWGMEPAPPDYDPRCIHGRAMPTPERAGEACALCDANTAAQALADAGIPYHDPLEAGDGRPPVETDY